MQLEHRLLGCFQQGIWQAPMLGCPTRNLHFPFSLSDYIAIWSSSLEGLFSSLYLLRRSPQQEESRRPALLRSGEAVGREDVACLSLQSWLLAHAGPQPDPWQPAAAHSAHKWPHPLQGPAGLFHNCEPSMEPVLGKLGTGQLSPGYGRGLGP